MERGREGGMDGERQGVRQRGGSHLSPDQQQGGLCPHVCPAMYIPLTLICPVILAWGRPAKDLLPSARLHSSPALELPVHKKCFVEMVWDAENIWCFIQVLPFVSLVCLLRPCVKYVVRQLFSSHLLSFPYRRGRA